MKKFIIAKFLNFKTVAIKAIVTRVLKLHGIIHDLLSKGLIVKNIFQVSAIMEKLRPLWKDFY